MQRVKKRPMMSGADINGVKDLLPLLYNVPVTYIFEKKNARLEGFVTDGGYACSCPVSDSCGYRGKVLSALQFEKHAGAESKNQNGHIFLRNGKSLYLLFQDLRDVPAEAFAEEFLAAAGVPMTACAAEAPPAPLGQQSLALASLDWDREPNGVQVGGFAAEPTLAPVPALGDVEILTEEEKARASFSMLGLRENSCTIQLDPMFGVERPAAEQIKDAAGCDHVLPDVKEINNGPGQQPSSQVSAAGEMISCLKDCLKESSISNLNWNASKRRSGRTCRRGTVTSTPSFSGSPDKGVCGLSSGTSKKEGSEGTCSENKSGPLSFDDLKSDSPVPTAVTPKYSKHDSTNLGLSLSSQLIIAQGALPNCSINSKSKELKTRDTTLHPLIFKEGGLPDNTLLTYKLKNGEALKQGYKRGTGIVCNCCNQEFTPSHFEEHAGMGKRRQPYHNIYTSEGLTLHKLALQLQDHLSSNGFGNASVSSFSDYPNHTSSGGCNEPSTTTGRIVPLKRTLQERVVETESCYFCGYGHTMLENIHPNMIVFCNQCERPCHLQCYNDSCPKKAPLEILKEYFCFRFMCCQECQMLRSHLQGLEKCVDIASPRQIRSRTCWRLLSGMDASMDVKLYVPQVIDIFKDAFVESTDGHNDIFSDMAYGKNGKGENDFRGMYCALLTASTRVVSAAILKVRMKQIAELVLVATRSECRKKGYFLFLLKSIEAFLRTLNVTILTAPVDPEMAQIWSDKLGFTILSAEEKKSMLESHPLVMFKNLVLVQKSL